jgi:hypothetical protein
MKVQVNVMPFLAMVLSLIVAYMTATGSILQFIQFQDVLNEIFFFIAAFFMAIGFGINAFSKIEK